jgi:hypothetical protein
VASTCRLMRRSIMNYTAMKLYFLDEAPGNVFSALSETDWTLVREMEAVTHYLSQLALSEVQAQTLLSSYMVVYRTLAETQLKSRSFMCLTLRPPTSSNRSDTDQPREAILVENFTKPGQVCLARCLAQVRERFPPVTVHEAVALLLDPRTKDCAGDIIDGMGSATMHREKLLNQARELIINEEMRHRRLHHSSQIGSDQPAGGESPPVQYSDLPTARPCSGVFFGSPVPTKTKMGFQESHLRQDATAALNRWAVHQEDWVDVAITQGVGDDRATLSKKMCYKRDDDTVCWNIVALSHIDILRWFRDVGESQFPTIAVLARLWLGKVSSTAFQERVFSTAGIVMSARRSQTDNQRAEKQLLLRVNRDEIETGIVL